MVNILLINATMKKGSTYHIGRMLVENLCNETENIEEIFLPEAQPNFCIGCANCFMKGEEFCPHLSYTDVIIKAIEKADILIFTTPVYVYHTSGQMKTLLDHFGYMWMVHRPNWKMFKKQAIVISTAAGAGMKSTNKDITDSLTYWGVGRIYTYGKRVGAINWDGVKSTLKDKINKDMIVLSKRVEKRIGKVTPNLKVKCLFYVIRLTHKKGAFNEVDRIYWENKGWLKKGRPWLKN